jgi:hypothetical protein
MFILLRELCDFAGVFFYLWLFAKLAKRACAFVREKTAGFWE